MPEHLPEKSELPPFKKALQKLVGEHLRKFLSMRAAYINVISKPPKPNTNKRVSGWLAEPERDPKRQAAYLNPPKPYSQRDRYTVRTEDAEVSDTTIPIAGGKEDADRWIDRTIKQIEQVLLAETKDYSPTRDRKGDHPLLMAVYHVLKASKGQAEGIVKIPHDVCMNLAREDDDIYYGDVETGFIAEGDTLMEDILALGEKYDLIVDKRKPQIVNGNVQLGYTHNPRELGLKLGAKVRAAIIAGIQKQAAKITADIEHQAAIIAEAKRRDPWLLHLNKGQAKVKNGWTDEEVEQKWDFSGCL